jgi:hypothetical protein
MIFKPSDRDRAILFMDNLFEKKKFIKIDYVSEAKSLNQNSYLWLVFTHVAVETGSDKNDMYYYWLDKFPKYKEVKHLGESKMVRISLSEFNKDQTKMFIDEVTRDARMEGFDVPDPEDLKAIEMMNYYRQKGYL